MAAGCRGEAGSFTPRRIKHGTITCNHSIYNGCLRRRIWRAENLLKYEEKLGAGLHVRFIVKMTAKLRLTKWGKPPWRRGTEKEREREETLCENTSQVNSGVMNLTASIAR